MIHYHPKSQLVGQNRCHPSDLCVAHASSTFAKRNMLLQPILKLSDYIYMRLYFFLSSKWKLKKTWHYLVVQFSVQQQLAHIKSNSQISSFKRIMVLQITILCERWKRITMLHVITFLLVRCLTNIYLCLWEVINR